MIIYLVNIAQIYMKSYFLNIKKNNSIYLMLLPAVVGFILFQFVPIFYALIIPFKDYSLTGGLMSSPWAGLKYFIQFFKDPFLFRIVRNTVILGFYNLLWTFPTPIIISLLLNEIRKGVTKKFVQTSIFLPYFISLVVLIGIMYSLLGANGALGTLLDNIGLPQIDIITNPAYFRSLYVISEIWQKAGWSSVIYLAALSGIRQELYDATAIDGASRWQQMWHVSISEIRPVIVFMLIWNVGNMFNVSFEKVLLMYSPTTYSTSDIMQTYVYRRGILGLEYGYAGAVGLVNALMAVALLLIMNSVLKKTSGESLF
jgi:putative aldouronate transport system permease protein